MLNTVIVIGPLPPPMHGMAHATASVAEALQLRCDLRVANISSSSLIRGVRYHLTRIARFAMAARLLFLHARAKGVRLYMPVAAGAGMYYTIIFVAIGRLLGYRTFLHHHSFAYIDRRLARMAVLTRCAGHKATHIFLCADMERRFRGRYSTAIDAVCLSNAWHIPAVAAVPARTDAPMTLGHLSNLGPEKGLDDVLETFRRLVAKNAPVRLVLAGPIVTPESQRVVEAAKLEFGDILDYRGPAFDADKERFYRDIDVFLFPTRYVNEAQPYVIFEAMAQGVPSVAYARGCIADDIGGGGGVSVPVQDSFVEVALPILSAWAADGNKLREARNLALARSRKHRQLAEEQYGVLIDALTSSPVPSAP